MRLLTKALLLAGIPLMIMTAIGIFLIADGNPQRWTVHARHWCNILRRCWDYLSVDGIFLPVGAVLWTVLSLIFAKLVPDRPQSN